MFSILRQIWLRQIWPNFGSGSLGDEIGVGRLLPLRDLKADIASEKSSCAAAIGSNVRFLIRKQTLREAPANDRFWPK